jgi:hypothetical protein
LPPSAVVTVIIVLPAATAFTIPFGETVAIELLAEVHVTFWFVALAGLNIGVNVIVGVDTSVSVAEVLERVTPLTGITVITVTVQVAVILPSSVVTVIMVVPLALAVTTPSITEAIVGLAD